MHSTATTGADLRYKSYLLAEHFLGRTALGSKIHSSKENLRRKQLEPLLQRPRRAADAVEEVHDLAPTEFFTRYYRTGVPVVFKGVAKSWRCCKRWTFDLFREDFADVAATVTRTQGFDGPDAEHEERQVTLAEVLRSMETDNPWYLRFSPLLQQNPELIGDLDLDWIRAHRKGASLIQTTQFFLGAKGANTRLHSDQPSNLTLQVAGRKHWTLYSSRHLLALHPEILRSTYFPSLLDTQSSDGRAIVERLPRYEVTLEPGDVLYNAPFTWHEVVSETDSISVVIRSSNVFDSLRGSALLSFLRLAATNPPIWHTLRRTNDACFGYAPNGKASGGNSCEEECAT